MRYPSCPPPHSPCPRSPLPKRRGTFSSAKTERGCRFEIRLRFPRSVCAVTQGAGGPPCMGTAIRGHHELASPSSPRATKTSSAVGPSAVGPATLPIARRPAPVARLAGRLRSAQKARCRSCASAREFQVQRFSASAVAPEAAPPTSRAHHHQQDLRRPRSDRLRAYAPLRRPPSPCQRGGA